MNDPVKVAPGVTMDGVWIVNREGCVLDVNDIYCAMSGYNREELLGMLISDIEADQSPETVRARIESVWTSGMARFEARHRKKNGSIYDVEVSAQTMSENGDASVIMFLRDITVTKRTAADLRESERRYRRIAEAITDYLYTVEIGPDGAPVTRHGAGCVAITGYSPEDFISDPYLWISMVHREDRKLVETQVGGILQGVDIPAIEHRIIRKDGNICWVRNTLVQRFDQSGKLVSYDGIIHDITERKRMDAALRASEDRYHAMFEQSGDGVFILDTNGKLLSVNKTFARMHGFTVEEMLQKGLGGLDVEGTAPVPERIRRIMAGETLAFEVEHYHKDGYTFPLAVTANLITAGNEQLIIAIHRDITERKKMESELRLRDDITRNIAEGVYLVGVRDLHIVYANPRMEEMFGYAPGEMNGRHVSIINAPAAGDPVSTAKEIEGQLNRIGTYRGEVLNVKKDGTTFWGHATISRRHHPEYGDIYVSLQRDISESKKAEEERKRLQEQLLQAQKIESIGRLAGGVAHDINNMLMPILGYAELLTNAIPREDPRRSDAEAITRSTERIRDITRQLLAFARKQPIEMKTLDLSRTVSGFEKILRRTIREDVEIKARLGPSLSPIVGDAGQIEQIVLNLAINAQDAMPGGGVLRIETLPVYLDEAFASAHPGSAAGEYVALSITDNGVGMDQDIRSKIFEPFFTTKELGRGTGLGLSMVYGIVKQHGGYIDVTSEPGKGSTFTAYFPSVVQTQEMPLNELEPLPRGRGETLLVVEDQEDVLIIVSKMLETGGYRVLQANGGEAAMSASLFHAGKIDLLITDIIMPGITGKELFEKLLQLDRVQEVLYMSGYPADVISTKGALHPGTNFLQKPCSFDALMRKVRDVLDGRE